MKITLSIQQTLNSDPLSVDIMLVHCGWHWPSIKPALGQPFIFDGTSSVMSQCDGVIIIWIRSCRLSEEMEVSGMGHLCVDQQLPQVFRPCQELYAPVVSSPDVINSHTCVAHTPHARVVSWCVLHEHTSHAPQACLTSKNTSHMSARAYYSLVWTSFQHGYYWSAIKPPLPLSISFSTFTKAVFC